MFFGAPARSPDNISRLRRNGFDFGEIAIANAGTRRMCWESGVVNGGLGKFFLMAHGPLEDNPNDLDIFGIVIYRSLMATVNTLNRMSIRSLNIHLLVHRRLVNSLVLPDKIKALRGIVFESPARPFFSCVNQTQPDYATKLNRGQWAGQIIQKIGRIC